jgi:hypothetical protein
VLHAKAPAADPRQSQRLMAITAVLILIFAAVILFLWYSGPSSAGAG